MTTPGQGITSRAGIYCRMSLAAMDDTTKVDDQERICREMCERRGWEVVDVYQDNNRSAWQKNRKRPAWDRMLADVEAGKLDAIVVYHGDRLVRQPWDLELLLKLADGKGIRLASPTGSRNLDNDDDQFILSIEAAAARRESSSTSRRRKAQYARWRLQGRVRPGGRGGRAFCFATDGVTHLPADRCDIATREELTEGGVLDEMADRILAGESAGAIGRDVSARGWRTPPGGEFTHSTIRKMLMRPRYAGLMPDGVHEAAWEPVLDRPKWEAVCAVLDARRAGFGYTTNARKYLLSGIALCDPCGSGLQIRAEQHRAKLSGYGCVKPGCRKVQRQAAALDAYVIRRVCNRLARHDNPEPHRMPTGALEAEFGALAGQRAETEAAITDPAQGPRLPLLLARLDSLDARLAQLRELAGGGSRSRLLEQYAGTTEEQFRGLPLGVQRSLVSAAFTIRVKRASRRGPGFWADDVDMQPR